MLYCIICIYIWKYRFIYLFKKLYIYIYIFVFVSGWRKIEYVHSESTPSAIQCVEWVPFLRSFGLIIDKNCHPSTTLVKILSDSCRRPPPRSLRFSSHPYKVSRRDRLTSGACLAQKSCNDLLLLFIILIRLLTGYCDIYGVYIYISIFSILLCVIWYLWPIKLLVLFLTHADPFSRMVVKKWKLAKA